MFTSRIDDALELRHLQLEESEALFALFETSRAALSPWIDAGDLPASLAQTQDYIQLALMRHEDNGAIDAGLWWQGQLAGVAALHTINWHERRSDLGYWLAPACQGRGLMTQAVRALAHFAFAGYRLKRLAIYCAVHNLRSRAIPERLGFKLERIVPRGERINGRAFDQAIYGMPDYRWRGEPYPLLAKGQ